MKKDGNNYLHRIIKILEECRKLNHRTVIDVCAYADFDSRNAYYSLFIGKCNSLTTLIHFGVGAGVSDYYWPEYLDCCIKWLGITN